MLAPHYPAPSFSHLYDKLIYITYSSILPSPLPSPTLTCMIYSSPHSSIPLPTLSHMHIRYDTMIGEWKDGKMNGMGIYRGVDGDLYEGNNTSTPSHLHENHNNASSHSYQLIRAIDRKIYHALDHYTHPRTTPCQQTLINTLLSPFNQLNNAGECLDDKRFGFGVFRFPDGKTYEGALPLMIPLMITLILILVCFSSLYDVFVSPMAKPTKVRYLPLMIPHPTPCFVSLSLCLVWPTDIFIIFVL